MTNVIVSDHGRKRRRRAQEAVKRPDYEGYPRQKKNFTEKKAQYYVGWPHSWSNLCGMAGKGAAPFSNVKAIVTMTSAAYKNTPLKGLEKVAPCIA